MDNGKRVIFLGPHFMFWVYAAFMKLRKSVSVIIVLVPDVADGVSVSVRVTITGESD